jgi:hypothetical protein
VLTFFVVFQLGLDVALLCLLLAQARRRKAAPPAGRQTSAQSPPQWYREFLLLAEDVLALVEPVLDALESGRLPAPPDSAPPARTGKPASAGSSEQRREAFALLRAGVAPEDVARRGRLLPAEVRLIRNLVAAEAEMADPPRV